MIEWRDKPTKIRCDNGPEYVRDTLRESAVRRSIVRRFIQLGQPQQTAYIERYNETVRSDWLAHYLFRKVTEVPEYAMKWLVSYKRKSAGCR